VVLLDGIMIRPMNNIVKQPLVFVLYYGFTADSYKLI